MRRRCVGLHQVLQVREWNDLGAITDCLICEQTFQIGGNEIEEHYTPFSHTSTEGPDEDIDLLVLDTMLDG